MLARAAVLAIHPQVDNIYIAWVCTANTYATDAPSAGLSRGATLTIHMEPAIAEQNSTESLAAELHVVEELSEQQ